MRDEKAVPLTYYIEEVFRIHPIWLTGTPQDPQYEVTYEERLKSP